jgi:molybdopterin converting factor subunit 1
VKIKLKAFALARDLVGAESTTLDVPDGATVGQLRTLLIERFPQLTPLSGSLMIAVGAQYAADDRPLDPNAEVALIPPVSGG